VAPVGSGFGTLLYKVSEVMRTIVGAACLILCVGQASHAGESRWLAAGFSLVLPGAGQAYLGWRTSAQAFLLGEGIVWGSRAYLTRRSDGIEDSYVAFAADHAGSDPSYRNDSYYDDMTRYWNSERANSHYQDPARYTGTKTWSWRSADDMSEFESLVRDRRKWEARAKDILALAILNRAASALHCLRAHRSGESHRDSVALSICGRDLSLALRW